MTQTTQYGKFSATTGTVDSKWELVYMRSSDKMSEMLKMVGAAGMTQQELHQMGSKLCDAVADVYTELAEELELYPHEYLIMATYDGMGFYILKTLVEEGGGKENLDKTVQELLPGILVRGILDNLAKLSKQE